MAILQWLVCLMTIKVTECLTQRGAPAVRDENNYMYTKNSVNKDTVNWRCSKRGCRATLKTEKESLHVVGSILPSHDHDNQLLKQEAKRTEAEVISKYVVIDGASPSLVTHSLVRTLFHCSCCALCV